MGRIALFPFAWIAWGAFTLPFASEAHGGGRIDEGVGTAADTVVVCAPALRKALEPWLALRTAQGHRLSMLDATLPPQKLRDSIRERARGGTLRHLVLVGDAPELGRALLKSHEVPSLYQAPRVISRWGPDREIVTDNPFADIDDDGIPDLAIGRIPASQPDELSTIVNKILAFEHASLRGSWRQRIHFIAGVGGFGGMADSAIEMTTRKFLTDLIPAPYSTTMTYGSWRSPFCPDPRRFQDVAIRRLNEGCLFWVYLGHGQRTGLDRVHVPGGSFPIFDATDAKRLQCKDGHPIALMLACYTGAFDSSRECLAETMLAESGGPVTTICGSRMTMPYAMAVFGNSMLHEYFIERRETIGELVLHAKRSSMQDAFAEHDPRRPVRAALDAMASLIMPGTNPELLRDERLEHAALFHILGDPLLRFRYPQALEVDSPDATPSGRAVEISVRSHIAGDGHIDLLCRRDGNKSSIPTRRQFDPSDASLGAFQTDYERANDLCWKSWDRKIPSGESKFTLDIPREAWGACIVRVHVANDSSDALGASEIRVDH
ncbi:MAG: hypothetical protein FJ297_14125 [Planctomycetes bacterium]|nr:hypothetical protein [Planctomycetota bacterium]